MKNTLVRVIFAFYLLGLLFLAIRPKVPFLYENILPGSDIGGWCMYQYLLEQEVSCYFISETNDTSHIDWKQHFCHSTFASSAHPNYYDPVGNEFLAFMKKNNPEISEIKKNNVSGELFLNINLIKERKDTLFYNYSINIP